MISAVVLGIALVSLVQMHTTSIRGTARAEDIGRATEIARQIGQFMASQPLNQIPACGNPNAPLPAGPQGCRASEGPGTVLSTTKTFPCTRLVDEDGVVDAATGDIPVSPATSRGSYRIDMLLSSHPNGATGMAQIHVWVCWRDAGGNVNEVSATQTKIVGLW